MKFGLLTSLQNPPFNNASHQQLYKELLEQTAYADKLGYDSFTIPEHHFLQDGWCPSLLTTLAAVAARTSNIKIGTACLLLPLHDPIHVAEEAAVLDLISNGRLILGVTIGYRGEEFEAFGKQRHTRGAVMEEQLKVITQAWTQESFSFNGKHFTYRNLSVTPKPVQKPHPPIWIGASSEPGIKRAGRWRFPLVASPRHHLNELKEHYKIYWKSVQEAGTNVTEIPIIRYAYLAETRETAEKQAQDPVMHLERDSYGAWVKWRALKDDKGQAVKDQSEVTYESHRERFIFGTANDCIQEIERCQRELKMNHFIAWTALPGLPQKNVLKSMKLMAEEVIPQFR